MKKYTIMMIILLFMLLFTGCIKETETNNDQEIQSTLQTELQMNQQELQQLKSKVEILENNLNDLNDNVINTEKSTSESNKLIVKPTNFYIENNRGIVEFEILNSESDVYGFEIIQYKEDGSTTLIIPDYHLEILPNELPYDSKKIRLEYNNNKEFPKLIVMIYEFKTGRIEQLIWDAVSDI